MPSFPSPVAQYGRDESSSACTITILRLIVVIVMSANIEISDKTLTITHLPTLGYLSQTLQFGLLLAHPQWPIPGQVTHN